VNEGMNEYEDNIIHIKQHVLDLPNSAKLAIRDGASRTIMLNITGLHTGAASLNGTAYTTTNTANDSSHLVEYYLVRTTACAKRSTCFQLLFLIIVDEPAE